MLTTRLKVSSEEAVAIADERLFHWAIVLGKKLCCIYIYSLSVILTKVFVVTGN